MLRPSHAPIWAECSGSVQGLEKDLGVESKQSRDGTAAHWLGAELLRMFKMLGGYPAASSFIGRECPENGVIIEEGHAEGAQVYADYVARKYQEVGGELLIEKFVRAPQIHPDNEGTLDCAIVNLNTGVIMVIDYKHGHSQVKTTSWQLINYLAALVHEYQIDGSADQLIRAHLAVVQPFCYQAPEPVREYSAPLGNFRGDFNHLHHQAHASRKHPVLKSGTHCRWCPMLWTCPSARQAAYKLFDHAEMPPSFDEMSAEALGIEFEIMSAGVRIAQSRLEAIEDVLKSQITDGNTGSGYTVESKPGRLKWNVEPREVYALGLLAGKDLRQDKPLTPTQAANLVPELKQQIDGMARRDSALKLTKLSETKSARAFGNTGN